MREQMNGKGVDFQPKSAFQLCFFNANTCPQLFLTWRVNIFIYRQRRGMNRRNESTERRNKFTNDINQ